VSNASRIVLRRAWREDHPAHFNLAQKHRVAAAMGGKLTPRRSFGVYTIEKLQPKRYAAMVARALAKQINAGRAQVNTDGDVLIPQHEIGAIERDLMAEIVGAS
jgi:hypothetical protein